MLRFVSFAWHDRREDRSDDIARQMAAIAARDGRDWSPAYRAPGLEVWCTGSRPGRAACTLLPDGGVILGRVISRAEGFPEWLPCPLTAAAGPNRAAKAAWLFAHVWGSYVAFLPCDDDGPLAIIRDPSGDLPCYRVRWRDFDVFVSNAETIRLLPGLTFTLDPDALATIVAMPLICKARTGLDEVAKVLPGECLTLGDEPRRDFPWDPVAIARAPLNVRVEEAAVLLRETLVAVVAALARPYPQLLHNLGGLDSSILLACLAAIPEGPEVGCVNFYTASLGGDERRYTRAMAAHAGVPLVERRLEPDLVDLDVWRAQEMGPSPPAMFDCLTLAGDVAGLIAERDPDVLCYGTGGDSVLFQAPYIYSALDYVAAGAPVAGLARVALEAAQYGGRSLWSTAWAMIGERLRPQPCADAVAALMTNDGFSACIAPASRAGAAWLDELHPMLRAEASFPKGKYFQLIATAFFDLESHRHRFARGLERDYICPLLAQPFVELCLRLPTWQLADGGVNRGLARRAFERHLPREILGRTSKSTTEGVYHQLLARHLPALREALLDGTLARSGFFRRERVEAALAAPSDPLVASDPALLFDLYAWELWAQRWTK